MDTPDSTLVGEVAEKYQLPPAVALELYDESNSLRVLPPPRVQQLKRLVEHLLSPLMTGEQATLRRTQERLSQQSRINEHMQAFKERGIPAAAADFLRWEKEWLTKVRVGNRHEMKRQLDHLLAYILYTEGGVTDGARARTTELTVMLSRVTVENGAVPESVLEATRQTIEKIQRAGNADALCQPLQDMSQACMDAVLHEKDKGNHYVRRALSYISERYSEPLSLSDVAAHLGISPNYLSVLFHQTTNISFRDYLCQVRVEESKHLLLSTDLSLVEIAIAVGFPDQSYFCKVFKKTVGLTPGKFRA
jgi:AraC-like DNA-binding protein